MSDQSHGDIVTRRGLLLGGLAAAGGAAALATTAAAQSMPGHDMAAMSGNSAAPPADPYAAPTAHGGAHGDMMTVGQVDYKTNGFDPTALLTTWDTGTFGRRAMKS